MQLPGLNSLLHLLNLSHPHIKKICTDRSPGQVNPSMDSPVLIAPCVTGLASLPLAGWRVFLAYGQTQQHPSLVHPPTIPIPSGSANLVVGQTIGGLAPGLR